MRTKKDQIRELYAIAGELHKHGDYRFELLEPKNNSRAPRLVISDCEHELGWLGMIKQGKVGYTCREIADTLKSALAALGYTGTRIYYN